MAGTGQFKGPHWSLRPALEALPAVGEFAVDVDVGVGGGRSEIDQSLVNSLRKIEENPPLVDVNFDQAVWSGYCSVCPRQIEQIGVNIYRAVAGLVWCDAEDVFRQPCGWARRPA